MKLGLTFYLNIVTVSLVLAVSFGVGLFMIGYDPIGSAIAQESEDTEPPKLFNIEIGSISATSTVISWKTDELSDSLINYSLNKNYGILREPRFDKLEHSLVLEDLMPGMDYYFRITSTDSRGNQGISSDYSFRTPTSEKDEKTGYAEEVIKGGDGGFTENVSEVGKAGTEEVQVEGKISLSQVIQFIKEIVEQEGQNMPSSEEILEQITEEVQSRAEEIVAPPTIILDYADVEVGTDYAIITWATDKESNTIVALAKEADFDPNREDPYVWREGNPDEMTLAHSVEITGLDPSTIYHFQVSSESMIGLKGVSTDKTFKTKSIKPEIYNLQIYKIEEESATIRWSTNVPCSSVINYTNLNNNESKLEGNSSFLTVHSVRLSNLVFDTYYSAYIKVESEDGETAESDPMTFITTRDEYAPIISRVNTESTIYPGSDNKIQTIASWQTDEPSVCQLFYHQGLVTVNEPESLPMGEDYSTKHVQVITNFIPATVYKFWIVCADEAENEAKSDDFTMLTPTQEESIIDIILKNFESSFGWVKKMKL
jgi:hypothetical protein